MKLTPMTYSVPTALALFALVASPALPAAAEPPERGTAPEQKADPDAEAKTKVEVDGERLVWTVTVGDEKGEKRPFVFVPDGSASGKAPLAGVFAERKPRAFLGVRLASMSDQLREAFGVPRDAGVLVDEVVEGSPAENAGLRAGDVITAVAGEPVADANALQAQVFAREEGEVVTIELWRDREVQTVEATLGKTERPRVDLSRLVIRVEGEDKQEILDTLNPEGLMRELRELEIEPMPLYVEKLEKAIQSLREAPLPPAPPKDLSEEELAQFQERREQLQRRLRELEKRIEELEKRVR
jgi:membrane-associated protease RseP (regulator of RpoE activity)